MKNIIIGVIIFVITVLITLVAYNLITEEKVDEGSTIISTKSFNRKKKRNKFVLGEISFYIKYFLC